MRVLYENTTSADYYREEAEKIPVDEDSDDEDETVSELILIQRKEKRALLKRADELEAEAEPTLDEIYTFLVSNDENMSKSRFAEMIDVCVLWHTTHNAKIYIKDSDIMISFVVETDPCGDFTTLDELEEMINDNPFEKSVTGGRVGNYCKFPSRKYPADMLGAFDVDGIVTQVTDLTGNVEWIEPDEESDDDSDEESEETKSVHPLYVRHEEIFGESSNAELDLDTIVPQQKKQKWSIIPKMIRRVFTITSVSLWT